MPTAAPPPSAARGAVGHTTTLAERKRRAGQRLVLGLAGPSLDNEQRSFFREVQPAGFIHFARNIESAEQIAELNRELVDLSPDDRPPLLSIDQEGGRVQRLKDTPWPSMRALGNLADLPTTTQVAAAMADELRATGFNLNFAPVCDVDSNPKNPVIGDRSFGKRPAEVAAQAVAFLEGLHSHGVIGCAKHFPGHGDTSVDSHLALPVVDKELGELREVELPPFAAMVKAGVAMVMTSHVLFPDLDRDLPATLSEKVLKRLLRDELGYNGVVISDDLEMKAVRGRWAVPELVELATRATVDLFCVGRSFEHDLTLSGALFEALVRSQEADNALDRAALDATRRLWALRLRFLRSPSPPPDRAVVGGPAFRALAAFVRARGAEAGLS
jgi:beta-N-acetylhexosaminidase